MAGKRLHLFVCGKGHMWLNPPRPLGCNELDCGETRDVFYVLETKHRTGRLGRHRLTASQRKTAAYVIRSWAEEYGDTAGELSEVEYNKLAALIERDS